LAVVQKAGFVQREIELAVWVYLVVYFSVHFFERVELSSFVILFV